MGYEDVCKHSGGTGTSGLGRKYCLSCGRLMDRRKPRYDLDQWGLPPETRPAKQSISSGGRVEDEGLVLLHEGELVIPKEVLQKVIKTKPEYVEMRGQPGWFRDSVRHSDAARRGSLRKKNERCR